MDFATTDEHLFDMVEGSLKPESFNAKGKPKAKGPDARIWEKSIHWFESLSPHDQAKVMESEDQSWIRLLLQLHAEEAEKEEAGAYIFNLLNGLRTNLRKSQRVPDYPTITQTTSYRFVPWRKICEQKKSAGVSPCTSSVEPRKRRYTRNQCAQRLVSALRLRPQKSTSSFDKVDLVKVHSKGDTDHQLQVASTCTTKGATLMAINAVKWTIGLDSKVLKKGKLKILLEEASKESCTREFYLQVEKAPKAKSGTDKMGQDLPSNPDSQPPRLSSDTAQVLNEKTEFYAMDDKARLETSLDLPVQVAKSDPGGGMHCMFQRGRLAAYSLGAFVAYKLKEQLKLGYQRQSVAANNFDQEIRLAQTYWATLDKAVRTQLVTQAFDAHPDWKAEKGLSKERTALKGLISTGFWFRLSEVRHSHLLEVAWTLFSRIRHHKANVALQSLVTELEEGKKPKKKKKKRSRNKGKKLGTDSGVNGQAHQDKVPLQSQAGENALGERDLRSGLANEDKEGCAHQRTPPKVSKKRRRMIIRDIISGMVSKATTIVHRKQRKSAYKAQSRRRFAESIVRFLCGKAMEIAEKKIDRAERANRRGSPACQAKRRELLVRLQARRKNDAQKFLSPAIGISPKDFVLTPLCVNGRPGMNLIDLSSQRNFTHQCWWWGGKFKALVIQPEGSPKHASVRVVKNEVTLYCRFGDDCQRIGSCPNPHKQPCSQPQGSNRPPPCFNDKLSNKTTASCSRESSKANEGDRAEVSKAFAQRLGSILARPAIRRLVGEYIYGQAGGDEGELGEDGLEAKVAVKSARSEGESAAMAANKAAPSSKHQPNSLLGGYGRLGPETDGFSLEERSGKGSGVGITDHGVSEGFGDRRRTSIIGERHFSRITQKRMTELVPRKGGARGVAAAAAESTEIGLRQTMNESRLWHSMNKCLAEYLGMIKNCGEDLSLFKTLSSEIRSMAAEIKYITSHQKPVAMAIIDALRKSLRNLWPTARAEIYGSFATGLCTPSSDVDVVICDTERVPQDNPRSQSVKIQKLAKYLEKQKWVRSLNTIPSASVPIIKIIASVGHQPVALDLSFDSSFHRGLPTCAFVKGLCIEYPTLEPLALVLKQFLSSKKINNPYTGGLSSYGLVLMLASMLQRDQILQAHIMNAFAQDTMSSPASSSNLSYSPTSAATNTNAIEEEEGRVGKGYGTKVLPAGTDAEAPHSNGNNFLDRKAQIGGNNNFNRRSSGSNMSPSGRRFKDAYDILPYVQRGFFSPEAELGRLLVTFLHTFGRRFDPQLHAVSVSNSEDAPDYTFSGAKYRHIFPNHCMVIIDPFNQNNNIARTCFNIWQIQQVFSTALNSITDCFGDVTTLVLRGLSQSHLDDASEGDSAHSEEEEVKTLRDAKGSGKGSTPAHRPRRRKCSSLGGLKSPLRKRSLLGAAFSTSHHRNVLAYERKIWVQAVGSEEKLPEPTYHASKESKLHLQEYTRAMQRKKAVTIARIEELEAQIVKRRELNDILIEKAEARSEAVGKVVKENENVDSIMNLVEDLTSYLAWVNDQRRSNIAEIEHLTLKIKSIKSHFYSEMKNLAISIGKTPFTIEQLQRAIQGDKISPPAQVKRLVDRKTLVARWRIAQLEEDIEDMEQMKVALEACAEYQVAKLATQKLKESTTADGKLTSIRKSKSDFGSVAAAAASQKLDKKRGKINSDTLARAIVEGFTEGRLERDREMSNDIQKSSFRPQSPHIRGSISEGSMHEHALDWCPKANVPLCNSNRAEQGNQTAEDDIQLRFGNFLAWINQQNRVNHKHISYLRAKVDRERQKYFYDIARLAIESANNYGSSTPGSPMPSDTSAREKKEL